MKSSRIYVGSSFESQHRIASIVDRAISLGWSNVRLCDNEWRLHCDKSVDEIIETNESRTDLDLFTLKTNLNQNKFCLFMKNGYTCLGEDTSYLYRFVIPRLCSSTVKTSSFVDNFILSAKQLLCKYEIFSNFSQDLEFNVSSIDFWHDGIPQLDYSTFCDELPFCSYCIKFLFNELFDNLKLKDAPWLAGKTVCFILSRALVCVYFSKESCSDPDKELLKIMKFSRFTYFVDNYNFRFIDYTNKRLINGSLSDQRWDNNAFCNENYCLDSGRCSIDYFCVPASYTFRNPKKITTEDLLLSDYNRVKLPVMSQTKITSSSEGIFDLYWSDDNAPDSNYYFPFDFEHEYVARDPWELVRNDDSVAIDFGTSSTVVAVKDRYSRVSVRRMGSYDKTVDESVLGDFQYENPTVLNFIDVRSFMDAWRDVPYRPDTYYNNLQFSHDAKEQWKDHPCSCMKSLKTWCRTDNQNKTVRLTDESGYDFEIDNQDLAEKTAVSDLVDGFKERNLDPIEVYAYLLGCSINNQSLGNGSLYLKYYMTFPVKFDNRTKQRIMQGFKRGLARSLPPSLVYSSKWEQMSEKCGGSLPLVEEIASEPITLAASFLEALNIEPTDEGVPFGVFDFGGGTTDFAVGLYRNATENETESSGAEVILDILDSSGDQNLGGEHIIDMMVYEVIRDNLSDILNGKINFVLPSEYSQFPGSDTVWSTSRYAYENSNILSSLLRDIWEKGALTNIETGEPDNDNNVARLVMLKSAEGGISSSANIKEVTLSVDQEKLRNMICGKISEGLERFMSTVRSASVTSKVDIKEFHVIFSGNSCRSPLTIKVIEEFGKKLYEGMNLILHTEFIVTADKESSDTASEDKEETNDNRDDHNLYASTRAEHPWLTLKTGVALGIFKLLRGEYTGCLERNKTGNSGEAPFNYFVGKFVKGRFVPILNRNCDYDNWIKFDKVKSSLRTKICWTADPSALEKNAPDTVVHYIDHQQEHVGWNIYIRPDSTHSLKIGVAKDEVTDNNIEAVEIIEL